MLYHVVAYNQVELIFEFLHLKYIGGNEMAFRSILLEKNPCVSYPFLGHVHTHNIAAHTRERK